MTAKRPAWLPTKAPYTRSSAAPQQPVQRRPFSRPAPPPQNNQEQAQPTAQILPFTGSNTPYESHE